MSVESLTTIAAAILAFLFEYIPGFQGWYGKLEPVYKKLLMLLFVVGAAGGVFAIACSGKGELFGVQVVCDQKSAGELIYLVLLAIGVNQGVSRLTKKTG